MAINEPLLPGLGGGPSVIASQAAIELDHLLLGRASGLFAVQKLAELIESEFQTGTGTGTHSHGAAAVGVMRRALAAANGGTPPTSRVDEVVTQAGQVTQSLKSIVADPEGFKRKNPAEVARMRSFCVAYSEQASGAKRLRGNRPPRRHRR